MLSRSTAKVADKTAPAKDAVENDPAKDAAHDQAKAATTKKQE